MEMALLEDNTHDNVWSEASWNSIKMYIRTHLFDAKNVEKYLTKATIFENEMVEMYTSVRIRP